ncbi:MAG: chemotaxis protein CheA [Lysobacterales bacterium]
MDELDLQQVNDMFLEECAENVDVLERGLLQMGEGAADADVVNEVFRAAHSIKGGGATFGFMELSELTHFMETLLDEMRSENRPVVDADVELLLKSVDIVRAILEDGGKSDHEDREAMQAALSASVGAEVETPADDNSIETSSQPQCFTIMFKPLPELMQRGNDPLLLVREVSRLGELSLKVDTNSIPGWGDLDASLCHMAWTAELHTEADQEAIEEIFEWVELDCDLTIERIEVPSKGECNAEANGAQDQTPAKTDEALEPKTPSENGGEVVATTPVKEKKALSGSDRPAPASAPAESTSIRIATDKIDQMINLVGELVITQSMLNRLGGGEEAGDPQELRARLAELERNTRELQESVMRVRMLPMSTGFSRLPRLVRDLSRKLDKQVELVVEGGGTEIDKTVLERMMDPLVHLVRNSLDHGLEGAAERTEAGKSASGTLTLCAYQESGSIVITIADDGRGIDRERVLSKAIEKGVAADDEQLTDEQVYQLLFAPGFSTAETVSDVSGRGVGMDVVRRNIVDLGGRVEIASTLGKGTTVTIRLPLTLAILDGQLIRAAGQDFVVPLLNIIETLEEDNAHVTRLPGSGEVCRFRGAYVPLIDLAQRLRLQGAATGKLVVILEIHGQSIGVLIDQVLGQQQVVVKALEDNYRSVPGIAGATIMSDGSVALIIDPSSLAPETELSQVA